MYTYYMCDIVCTDRIYNSIAVRCAALRPHYCKCKSKARPTQRKKSYVAYSTANCMGAPATRKAMAFLLLLGPTFPVEVC